MSLDTFTPPPAQQPSITDPSNFDQEAEDWVEWWATYFMPEMATFVEDVNLLIPDIESAGANGAIAAAAAVTAINAPGTMGTSTTSMSIGSGSKTFTTQTGKSWGVGQIVVVARTSDPAKHMIGPITAYNSGTGSMTVDSQFQDLVGGGPFTDWTISLTADPATITGALRVAAITGDTTAVAGYLYDFTATAVLTLPASPAAGDPIGFKNSSGTATPSIARNGNKIEGLSEDMTLNSVNAKGTLVYVNSTRGWEMV